MKTFWIENWIILGAFLTDLLIGDPRKCHPVRGIGKFIEITEKFLRKMNLQEKLGGILLFFIVTVVVFFSSWASVYFLVKISNLSLIFNFLSYLVLIFAGSLFIALNGLIKEAFKINKLLNEENLIQARLSLKSLVGRDTENLTPEKIKTAIIESLAENLSDGVIAPLFYFFIGGLPFMILYKTVNTLDSMVGYKNEKYVNFGWFSAKIDDAFNYIPARISGLMIVLSSFILFGFSKAKKSLKIMIRDGRNHSSPNSGIPESAMAGALGIRLGGPNYYGGILFKKPYIGDNLNNINSIQVDLCIKIVILSSFIFVFVSILIRGIL